MLAMRQSNTNREVDYDRLPPNILLKIFVHLDLRSMVAVSRVSTYWYSVSMDDLLWRSLCHRDWFSASKTSAPKRLPLKGPSWYSEYKRFYYHTPVIESQKITEHHDQVLHVSFSHNGKLFATSSKDGTIKVWKTTYPAELQYQHDMAEFQWKYTQFSQFNESDSLLLVSGVHIGRMSTSGEIAVFSLVNGFELQCRVLNKPYDVFGTWYNDSHLLSGNLHWAGHLNSCSALWLNKASQAIETEQESVVMRLYRFHNDNASSIRTIMIAKCLTKDPDLESPKAEEANNGTVEQDMEAQAEVSSGAACSGCRDNQRASAECQESEAPGVAAESVTASRNPSVVGAGAGTDNSCETCKVLPGCSPLKEGQVEASYPDKYLIFTMGRETYTPHMIGIKRIKSLELAAAQRVGLRQPHGVRLLPDVEDNNHSMDRNSYDKVDYSFDLKGHIIGMALSPDNRHLFVNSRPWPRDAVVENALQPPPIAQEIDLHVIDLVEMRQIGSLLRSHKAYTPNDECFFIFLDVSEDYVASGAEDCFGYMWDRYYSICVNKFSHHDVVNSVGFNPKDPEMLITVSDDKSIKIWLSRNRVATNERARQTPKPEFKPSKRPHRPPPKAI